MVNEITSHSAKYVIAVVKGVAEHNDPWWHFTPGSPFFALAYYRAVHLGLVDPKSYHDNKTYLATYGELLYRDGDLEDITGGRVENWPAMGLENRRAVDAAIDALFRIKAEVERKRAEQLWAGGAEL